jgi:hypothetical protein
VQSVAIGYNHNVSSLSSEGMAERLPDLRSSFSPFLCKMLPRVPPPSDAFLLQMCSAGGELPNYNKMTVKALKALLQARNLGISGLKADLVARLEIADRLLAETPALPVAAQTEVEFRCDISGVFLYDSNVYQSPVNIGWSSKKDLSLYF